MQKLQQALQSYLVQKFVLHLNTDISLLFIFQSLSATVSLSILLSAGLAITVSVTDLTASHASPGPHSLTVHILKIPVKLLRALLTVHVPCQSVLVTLSALHTLLLCFQPRCSFFGIFCRCLSGHYFSLPFRHFAAVSTATTTINGTSHNSISPPGAILILCAMAYPSTAGYTRHTNTMHTENISTYKSILIFFCILHTPTNFLSVSSCTTVTFNRFASFSNSPSLKFSGFALLLQYVADDNLKMILCSSRLTPCILHSDSMLSISTVCVSGVFLALAILTPP